MLHSLPASIARRTLHYHPTSSPLTIQLPLHHSRPVTYTPCLLKKSSKPSSFPASSTRPDQKPNNKSSSNSSKHTTTKNDDAPDPLDFSAFKSCIHRTIEELKTDLIKLKNRGRSPSAIEELRIRLEKRSTKSVALGDIAQVVPRGRVLTVLVEEKEVRPPLLLPSSSAPSPSQNTFFLPFLQTNKQKNSSTAALQTDHDLPPELPRPPHANHERRKADGDQHPATAVDARLACRCARCGGQEGRSGAEGAPRSASGAQEEAEKRGAEEGRQPRFDPKGGRGAGESCWEGEKWR